MANAETALELVSVAPPPKRELMASKDGFMKIRLTFLTDEPKHVRSTMLREQYGAKPPYTEDVCLLLSCGKTFSILETFIPAFEKLRESDVISSTAKLLKFKILDEDFNTLAYIFE